MQFSSLGFLVFCFCCCLLGFGLVWFVLAFLFWIFILLFPLNNISFVFWIYWKYGYSSLALHTAGFGKEICVKEAEDSQGDIKERKITKPIMDKWNQVRTGKASRQGWEHQMRDYATLILSHSDTVFNYRPFFLLYLHLIQAEGQWLRKLQLFRDLFHPHCSVCVPRCYLLHDIETPLCTQNY